MSKQDGYASRTAADLERKYNFGQTFAEVYNLVTDARKIAEEARNAYEGLDQEQIFNLLTNFGKSQGIYRDDDGNVYVNASYIKSGELDCELVTLKNLKIDLSGKISFEDLSDADEILTKMITQEQAKTLITDTLVSAPTIKGGHIKGGTFSDLGGNVDLRMSEATLGDGTVFGMVFKYGTDERFGVYCVDEDTMLQMNDTTILRYSGNKVLAFGTWDFSNAFIIGLTGDVSEG